MAETDIRNIAAVSVAADMLADVNTRLIEYREIKSAVSSDKATVTQAAAQVAEDRQKVRTYAQTVTNAVKTATAAIDAYEAVASVADHVQTIAAMRLAIETVGTAATSISAVAAKLAAIEAAPAAAQTATEKAQEAADAVDPEALQVKIMAMAATVEEVTAGNFTPTLVMNATIRILTHATGVSVTLPSDLPNGFTMGLIQGGEGQLTFAAASGATMKQVDDATKSRKIDAYVSLLVSKNEDGQSAEWRLLGDMEIP